MSVTSALSLPVKRLSCAIFCSLAVGALLGGPIGGWSIDKYGRKGTILLCAIFFEFGWLLIILAQNHAMLYAGRIVTGLACGMISLAVPVRY